MVSKFNPGDFVKYDDDIYLVKKVVFMNPDMPEDPFIYGIVSVRKLSSYSQLLVRQGLLSPVDPKVREELLEVLYGG